MTDTFNGSSGSSPGADAPRPLQWSKYFPRNNAPKPKIPPIPCSQCSEPVHVRSSRVIAILCAKCRRRPAVFVNSNLVPKDQPESEAR